MHSNPADADGLRLESVSAGYGGADVLHDINLSANLGECIAVLGPNGAGKSTLMRCIMGLVRPRRGTVVWANRALNDVPTHRMVERHIAIVPEGRRLYGGMSVEENLLMGAHFESGATRRRRLEDLYDNFPILLQRREQLAGTLSGGQQQLCALGRALMASPELLLIDELSLGLSPAAIAEVIDSLEVAIQKYAPTVVLVDQDVTLAASLATRGYFLQLGKIAAEGMIADLLKKEVIRSLYFGTVNADQYEAVSN